MQRELHWAEPEHYQVPPRPESSPSSQDNQTGAKVESSVRLCSKLFKECFQYLDCLHPVPGNFCPARSRS